MCVVLSHEVCDNIVYTATDNSLGLCGGTAGKEQSRERGKAFDILIVFPTSKYNDKFLSTTRQKMIRVRGKQIISSSFSLAEGEKVKKPAICKL